MTALTGFIFKSATVKALRKDLEDIKKRSKAQPQTNSPRRRPLIDWWIRVGPTADEPASLADYRIVCRVEPGKLNEAKCEQATPSACHPNQTGPPQRDPVPG